MLWLLTLALTPSPHAKGVPAPGAMSGRAMQVHPVLPSQTSQHPASSNQAPGLKLLGWL